MGYSAHREFPGPEQPWIGPDLNRVLADRAGQGQRHFLVVPIGFLMDHLEIPYDLDVAAQGTARRLGVTLRRTQMPNDDALLVTTLTDVTVKKYLTMTAAPAERTWADQGRVCVR